MKEVCLMGNDTSISENKTMEKEYQFWKKKEIAPQIVKSVEAHKLVRSHNSRKWKCRKENTW